MITYNWLTSIDWNRTYNVEQWNTGEVRFSYKVMSPELTEAEVRQNMLYWDIDNIWSLFKVFKIDDNFMRQIQGNMTEEDIKDLEHEIMIDCFMVRQCFVEQIQNYLTYIRACKIKYEEALKDKNNAQKLLRRLDKLMNSMEWNGQVVSYTDYNGNIQDQIVI